jgi:hypothetical protein
MEETVMNRAFAGLVVAATLLVAGAAGAQTDSSAPADTLKPAATTSTSRPSTTAPTKPRVYWGGAIGFNFWNDYTRFSVEPIVGYRLTPKFSLGGRLRYEYFNDKREAVNFTSHNYGGSIFSRYRLVPQLYGQAEFAYMSYDFPSGREGVPFLFLGGGYVQPLGGKAWAFVEVLVDVLQDSNSPYEDWDPQVTVGAGVGF